MEQTVKLDTPTVTDRQTVKHINRPNKWPPDTVTGPPKGKYGYKVKSGEETQVRLFKDKVTGNQN